MCPSDFTATELRILAVLADGLPHARAELHACIGDDLAPFSTVQRHISNIRKVLRRRGQDVVCESTGRNAIRYRHVRLLTAGE